MGPYLRKKVNFLKNQLITFIHIWYTYFTWPCLSSDRIEPCLILFIFVIFMKILAFLDFVI